MTTQQRVWNWSAVTFIVVAAVLSVVVERLTNRAVDTIESRFGEGYIPDPEATRQFLGELEHPTFASAAEESLAKVEYRDVSLAKEIDRAWKSVYGIPFEALDQGGAGTCVSFAYALACQGSMAVDWTTGRLAQPPPLVSTEVIYGGARTAGMGQKTQPGGDGATGAGAARWVSGKTRSGAGGILFRQQYGEFDLRQYSIPRSRDWGSRGVPDALLPEAAKNRAVEVAQVNTWDELCASLETGRCIVLCSNVGYGRPDGRMPTRDEDGALARGKSWNHALCVVGVRHAKNAGADTKRPRDLALIVNSWSGEWCSGPLWRDQPRGSFYAERKNVEAALDQGDSFAVSGVTPLNVYRRVDNGEWFEQPPGRLPPVETIAPDYSLAP
ncbi:hypothetical protein UFOVP898_19 [uncultured Caudovirales phage]|uniref:Peptidase C1A, papain C-terminal n=1 Tax=uncultured Caudovirales phage TaxID=2100421 RepID=A0A6J5PB77_9CAUD|nr:hypothetical protein UFOVP898_19 [uncultured Caudovirales phage]CAB4176563.1 hypothetical protein UFOVP985_40 [uncultured Caudovirales phage]CAB4181218.1 hypothetical protein UFOVP1073_17 [uncultured Caudovirales phage]CAB4198194.1 hypothetical protein UFOVP1308_56 [uncultured Caudovirales phage]CAB4210374.1 hypothetical protein UFOVP1423_13 [uncultured Caudovirales phage]